MPERFAHLDDAERAALLDAVERAATQVGLAVFVVHVNASPPVIVYASELLGRLVGRPAQELVGEPPRELLAPEDRPRIRTLIASRGPGAPPINSEVESRAPRRRPSPHRGRHRPGRRPRRRSSRCASCATSPASAPRWRRYAASQARFRSLIETAPDGVVILDRGRDRARQPDRRAAARGGRSGGVAGRQADRRVPAARGRRPRDGADRPESPAASSWGRRSTGCSASAAPPSRSTRIPCELGGRPGDPRVRARHHRAQEAPAQLVRPSERLLRSGRSRRRRTRDQQPARRRAEQPRVAGAAPRTGRAVATRPARDRSSTR